MGRYAPYTSLHFSSCSERERERERGGEGERESVCVCLVDRYEQSKICWSYYNNLLMVENFRDLCVCELKEDLQLLCRLLEVSLEHSSPSVSHRLCYSCQFCTIQTVLSR